MRIKLTPDRGLRVEKTRLNGVPTMILCPAEAIYDTTVSRREILRGDGCNVAFTVKGSTLYAIQTAISPERSSLRG